MVEMMKKKLSQLRRHSPMWLVFLALGAALTGLGFGLFNYWDDWQEDRFEADREQELEEMLQEEPSLLKIGFVTDWEYGTRKRLKHKLTNQAPLELEKAVAYMNTVFYPDIVIGGGDYVESSGVKLLTARRQLELVNNIFKKLEAPRLYAVGNHDVRSLSIEEVKEVLGLSETHIYQDIGDWRLIVMDTNYDPKTDIHRTMKSYVTGYVNKEELAWLSEALKTDRPVLVFSHHSPLPVPSTTGRTYIKNIENAPQVRKVLESAGNVVAVISGHNPTSYYEERNGIHYFVVDTMVNEAALGAFATIEAKYLSKRRHAELYFFHHGMRETRLLVDRTLGENEFDLIQKFSREFMAQEEASEIEGVEADEIDVGGMDESIQ